MNYIILNGMKSTLIKGLLIQSLPPISKPLMRTMVEEIDGRDGDIITKLGYSAYNKEIKIGLHGDYSVDDVISFFDSEGTVIFSNEPDKYYYYQIIEQIDFERLIRYKTATVTLHVQPFKYSTEQPYRFVVDDTDNFNITNIGNFTARPKLTIFGSGQVALNLNGRQVFEINLDEYITIDCAEMNAYKDDNLANRSVAGDYESFALMVGKNNISWSGNVTEIILEQFSRWR